MPDASLEAAEHRAEYLRQEVMNMLVHDNGQSHTGITLSLGVAMYPQHGRTIEAVVRAADAALYRAKQGGRNQVITAENAT
jgi:diguanylate cyclase (GGDEF)-like protein